MDSFFLRKLACSDVLSLAGLHISGIDSGFISSLGQRFVAVLYSTIFGHRKSFCFVAEAEGRILGFVAFTENLKSLYKAALQKNTFVFIRAIGLKLLSPKTIKRILQNLFYPSKTEKLDLPEAELLSIVVASEGRGRDIGRQLVTKGFEECRKRGIDKVKVLVAADNEPANKLYKKCGFELVTQIDSHGIPSNIYVANV